MRTRRYSHSTTRREHNQARQIQDDNHLGSVQLHDLVSCAHEKSGNNNLDTFYKADFSLHKNMNVREILDHIAHILAKEYVEYIINNDEKETRH